MWPSMRFYLYYLTGVSCIIESTGEGRGLEKSLIDINNMPIDIGLKIILYCFDKRCVI